jgi:hypothetical protein
MLDPPVFSPIRLVSSLRLAASGSGSRAGRTVVLAHGHPRRPPNSATEFSHEFEFDAEHGTILRHAAFADGHCVSLIEAVAVEYGGGVDSARFAFDAPLRSPAEGDETGTMRELS